MRSLIRRNQGFTVIELLIVVGIIAIMISVLLPVVSSVRNRARAVGCVSNERQIYAAMVAFVADHDGYLPTPAGVGYTVASGEGQHDAWAMDNNFAASGGVIDLKVGTLWPYISNTLDVRQQTVLCPGDNREPSSHSNLKTADRNFSYSFNANLTPAGHQNGTDISMKLTDVARPASRILIYEEEGPNDEWCFGGNNQDDLPSGRHGTARAYAQQGGPGNQLWMTQGLGNYCFFDGHVESFSPQTIMTDATHNPSMYQPLKQ